MAREEAAACRQHELLHGWTAVWLWCLPAAALVASSPLGDARWWVWCPALTLMGVACLANAARCGRRHCYLTGPFLLIAAVLSALRGMHVLLVGWAWIVCVILMGWAAGCVLEWYAGSYPSRTSA